MKLAYFSPLHPQTSGISDYSEELLMHLRNHFDIDLFVDGFRPSNLDVAMTFQSLDYQADNRELKRIPEYDAALYHLGNDYRYHSGIYMAMQKYPGIVVLHDFGLQDFFLGVARQEGQMSIYFDELEACHGRHERITAEEVIKRGAAPPHEALPLEFPLNCRIAREAEGVIVHSEWSRDRLKAMVAGTPIARIKHHITERAAETPAARTAANDRLTIASYGLVTPDKAIERVLRALSGLMEFDFRYLLVGSTANFPNLAEIVQAYGLKDRVEIAGYVSLEEFQQRILHTDIAINLRERPVGGTSGSQCRLMAAGIPTIVSNVGAFSEFPDDAVIKIDHDQHADALLQAYLRKLIEDASLREHIGQRARAYMLAEHSIERSAAQYAGFIHEVIARRPRRHFVAAISDELMRLNIRAGDDKFLRGVAAEIAALAPISQVAEAPAVPEFVPQPGVMRGNGHGAAETQTNELGRMPKVEGLDYKRGALEYARALTGELQYYLRTKPFCNLHKPIKYSGDGIDPETARHFYDFANMAVAMALRADARILDVGCGPGWLTEYFARLGYDVTGIDISDDLVGIACERIERLPYQVDQETPVRCRFLTHDIEAAPVDETYDAILCYDTLHHFEDEQSVFRNLAQMLDVGGLMFICEGYKPPAGSPTEEELQGVMRKYETLESPFSERYLRELIDQNGFFVVADYVSVNGLFERELLVGGDKPHLPLHVVDTNYHYLICIKVADGVAGSTVPDSRRPGNLQGDVVLQSEPPAVVAPGAEFKVRIGMVNLGDTIWLTGQTVRPGLVMPGVKITNDRGELVLEKHGPLLPRAVAPGRTQTLDVLITAPDKPGRYTVKIDLVDQRVCWFEELGGKPITFSIDVSESGLKRSGLLMTTPRPH